MGGEKIETPNGLVPIEEIKAGDKVYSTEGIVEVARPTRNKWLGSLTRLDGESFERSITCTDSHEFLILNKEGKVKWKAAKFIEEEDRPLTRILESPPREQLLNEETMELYGIFSSRGSIRNGAIEFLIYPGEYSIREKIIRGARKLDKNTLFFSKGNFLISESPGIVELFSSVFQVAEDGRVDTSIPEVVRSQDPSLQLYFAKGWLEGEKTACDGHLVGFSRHYNFIFDLKQLFLKNEFFPSVKFTENRFRFSIGGELGKAFCAAIIHGEKFNKKILPKNQIICFGNALYAVGEKIILEKISNTEEGQEVYCLDVPEGESFSVGGHMSHNCRAFSKTFISILGMYLICMFRPGAKAFICAPKKEQSAKIAKEKINEIWALFPILRKEIIGNGSFLKDQVTLTFRNGSIFDVVGALDSTRGGRRHLGLIDEVRDHESEVLNEVVLPLLNVSRRTVSGQLNPNEPHQVQFYMTSASTKGSYAYNKVIECLENSIISPNDSFVWGCSYKLPEAHGLIDRSFINEVRTSPTYREESFARELALRLSINSFNCWDALRVLLATA